MWVDIEDALFWKAEESIIDSFVHESKICARVPILHILIVLDSSRFQETHMAKTLRPSLKNIPFWSVSRQALLT
jgi:hypothetical protein